MSVILKERINNDVKAALRTGDKRRRGALRLILAAIKQREVDERITLDDAQIISVLDKMARQCKESIEMYQKAGRQDLVDQESFELQLLKEYMPAPLSEAEVDALVKKAITEAGAVSMKDIGKVMAVLKTWLQGRADMNAVSGLVKRHLS